MNSNTENNAINPTFGKPVLATVRFQFFYKDAFGNMCSTTIKVEEKDSEVAIAKFESTYPNITWRSFRALPLTMV